MKFSSLLTNNAHHRGPFRHKSRRKKCVFHGIIIGTVTFIVILFLSQTFGNQPHLQINVRDGVINTEEALETNCTTAAVEGFPSGFFTKEQRQHGAVVINFLVAFYIFGAIAVVCDDYFVPSLEGITEGLNLAPDVAGATFMAAGSSAPELFTSLIGVFITKGEIGLGTILGSAVFNLLFIIGLCGLFAGMVIQLLFWPMLRDSTYYLISIAALVLVIYDNCINWYESVILLLLYAGYIVIMYFNETLEKYVNRCTTQNQEINERTILTENEHITTHLENGKGLQINSDGGNSNEYTLHTTSNGSTGNLAKLLTEIEEEVQEENEHVLSCPEGFLSRCIYVTALPIYVTFYLTLPDCRRKRWKSWFAVTFFISVIYIGGLSYVLVWMVSIIGDTFNIPDTIMGLTLLAAGTSIPDAMASVLAARDGYGGMAISNSIGSNIFDILLCLGLPWLIQTLLVDFNVSIPVISTSITFTTIMLLATVFIMALIFYLKGGRLDKYAGAIFIAAYFVFLIICIFNDLNYFGIGSGILTCPP